MGYRPFIVQLLLLLSCLATVLCKELSSVHHKSIQHPYTKDGIWVDPSDPLSRKSYPSDVHPPKHIMKLMQQLSKNEVLLNQRGNTVRSYLPKSRFACDEPTYVFNIKPHKTESLRSVELHFFASKASNSNSNIDVHLHLITNTSSRCQPIGVKQRSVNARGWQVMDITAQISHIVKQTLESENAKLKVGVSFRLQQTGGAHDTSSDRITSDKMMSNHARPFLLMYAEDEDSNGNSVLQWTQAQEGAISTTRPKARSPAYVQSHTRHARSVDDSVHYIMTNEFPEGNTKVAHQATFQHFNEQDSKRRKAKKRTSKRRISKKQHSRAPLLDPSSSVVEDESQEEAATNDDRDQNAVLPMDPNDGPCSRRSMFVSFDTIDWDGYVIAPTGFEAFYCTGACTFPLSKTDNPSNHATIQSVMSVAGIRTKIPPPCCVPEKLSSLSILFLDENDNVGLKSYRNMVVESCGCR